MALPAGALRSAPLTGEDQLILAVAGTAGRRESMRARAVELGARIDPERLVTRLLALGLPGVLGPRLTPLLPAPGRDALARAVAGWIDANRAHAELHAAVLRSVRLNLAGCGVDAAPLKGPDLARRVHGAGAVRSSTDLDVLIRPGQMGPAVAALGRLGYTVLGHDTKPWRLELHQAVHHPGPEIPPVELHWRVEWYSGRPFAAGLLDRALADPEGTRRLQPVDELAALLLIAARDGLPGLRLLVDVAAWWDRYGGEVPAGSLQGLADAHPSLARPLATATAAAQRLVGLPAESLLDLSPARRRRSRLALRLADPLLNAPGPHGSGTALVDGLLSDRRALRGWSRRRLFRPRGHVALTYGLPPDARLRIALIAAVNPLRACLSFAAVLAARGPGPLADGPSAWRPAAGARADLTAGAEPGAGAGPVPGAEPGAEPGAGAGPVAGAGREAGAERATAAGPVAGAEPAAGAEADLPRRVAVHADVVWQVVDGHVVLVTFPAGRYYRLDDVAARMWVLLDELPDTAAALDRLSAEFAVDEATLRGDLAGFIAELVGDDLLRTAP
jgi:Uncharacterised nucleotidyltransferase/Coenzyme PQQ synthesis protein D (PqqD)